MHRYPAGLSAASLRTRHGLSERTEKDVAPARGRQPYGVMSLDDIKALPVEQVCARDCLLFMWTVSHLQAAAIDVAAAWGFKPVSVAFVWDKGRMGMGYWTRQEVEICHLFKRGRPRRLSKGVRSSSRLLVASIPASQMSNMDA